MKIVMTQDHRPYTGSPKEIVAKLRREAIQMPTADLDAYVRTVASELERQGFDGIDVAGDTTDERCESLLRVMITCGLARPVFEPGRLDSDAIRVMRKVRNLSQEALAGQLGVSFSTVNRWESGEHLPSSIVAQRIRECLFAPPRGCQPSGCPSRPDPTSVVEHLRAALAAMAPGQVVVHQGVVIRGGVEGIAVTIEGNVEGLVEAVERIEMTSSSKVTGVLHAPKVVIYDGAVFKGSVAIEDEANSVIPPDVTKLTPSDFLKVKQKLFGMWGFHETAR